MTEHERATLDARCTALEAEVAALKAQIAEIQDGLACFGEEADAVWEAAATTTRMIERMKGSTDELIEQLGLSAEQLAAYDQTPAAEMGPEK